MRHATVTLGIGFAAAGFLATAALAQVAMPHRKAGMWETTMNVAGQNVKTQLCLDAATDARMSLFGEQSQKETCGHTTTIAKIPGGYSFHNACGDHVTNGTAVGDFNTAYKVTADSGSTHVVMNSRWLGPCPPGRKPGDMVMPGGTVINMSSLK